MLLLGPRLQVCSPELWWSWTVAEVILAPSPTRSYHLSSPFPSIPSVYSSPLHFAIMNRAVQNIFLCAPLHTCVGVFLPTGIEKQSCWVHVLQMLTGLQNRPSNGFTIWHIYPQHKILLKKKKSCGSTTQHLIPWDISALAIGLSSLTDLSPSVAEVIWRDTVTSSGIIY